MTNIIIILLLSSVGLTFIVTRSSLFDAFRASFMFSEKLSTLFSCPQCFGFWANFISFIFLFPVLQVSPYAFVLLLLSTSFAASGLYYIINSFIEKE